MIQFEPVNRHSYADVRTAVGFIPGFVANGTDLTVREQLDANYVAGWSPFEGFTFNAKEMSLSFADDPRLFAIARSYVGEETILVFQYGWVLVLQSDGSFEVARMD